MEEPLIPRYLDLPQIPGTEDRHAWDVWGREDVLGSVNRLRPEVVRTACGLVREGRAISLALPLDEPCPGIFTERSAPRHRVIGTPTGRDDSLESFFLQFSSHWDGLPHVRYRAHYWGGREDQDLLPGALGVDQWASHGIFARGVLLDAVEHARRQGLRFDPTERVALDGRLLEEIAEAQGVALKAGDVLLLRTGWLPWYRSLTESARKGLIGAVRAADPLHCPGLEGSGRMAEWLWDHGVVAVAADNVAVEALPVDPGVGFLHRRLIPLLGITLGEFWHLEELADECRRLSRWEFFLSASPLSLRDGVGSPANAHAIL